VAFDTREDKTVEREVWENAWGAECIERDCKSAV